MASTEEDFQKAVKYIQELPKEGKEAKPSELITILIKARAS